MSTSGLLVQASPFPVLFADAPLTVNANMVGSPLVGFTDTNLHIIGADGHLSRILMDTFGSNAFGSLLEVRAAGGTATLPTGTPTGTSLLGLIAFGHNGTTFNNNGPAIAMVAARSLRRNARRSLYYIPETAMRDAQWHSGNAYPAKRWPLRRQYQRWDGPLSWRRISALIVWSKELHVRSWRML